MIKRRYLTQAEISSMLEVVRYSINGERNYCIILLAFIHGLRISELLSINLGDIDFGGRRINISRKKNGFSTVHPLSDEERDAIDRWCKVRSSYAHSTSSDRLFLSVKGKELSRQQAYKIIRDAGERAGTAVRTHPHMLRHACGYELAERGADTRLIQDYLGHRNIRHTVRYTASNAARFNGLWSKNNQLDKQG